MQRGKNESVCLHCDINAQQVCIMASSYIPFKALWHPVYSLYVVARPCVCPVSIMFVYPTQAIEINFPQCFMPSGTLAIC